MVQAMTGHVDQIISIEVAPALHARAATRFAGQRHIRLLQGDSATLLPAVLETLDGPALFWLDGHYMGGESGRGTEDTPVIAEMAALLGHTMRGHVVLIDDARLFDGTGGYPRLHEFTAWVKPSGRAPTSPSTGTSSAASSTRGRIVVGPESPDEGHDPRPDPEFTIHGLTPGFLNTISWEREIHASIRAKRCWRRRELLVGRPGRREPRPPKDQSARDRRRRLPA